MSDRPPSQRALLLDANVLLLLLVGLWNRERILRFKKLSGYDADDFDLLALAVDRFRTLVTTPHVLTEVSNLASFHEDPERTEFFEWLALRSIPAFREDLVPTKTIAEDPIFVRLGLTDAAIDHAARTEGLHVLTADARLYERLLQVQAHVTNFQHLRAQRFLD
jgi:hypothetical protein